MSGGGGTSLCIILIVIKLGSDCECFGHSTGAEELLTNRHIQALLGPELQGDYLQRKSKTKKWSAKVKISFQTKLTIKVL